MRAAEAVTEDMNTVIVAATAVVITAIVGKRGHKSRQVPTMLRGMISGSGILGWLRKQCDVYRD